MKVREAILWLFSRLSNRQFLLVGGIVVGLWAGLTAVILKTTVHHLQDWLLFFAVNNRWIYLVAPAAGIGLSALFVIIFLKGTMEKGTSHVLKSITKGGSVLPRKETFSHVVTSALTVGLGGSAGLESPIVQTGSAIGSVFASLFPIGYRERTLLLACGAAAGIATAFNAPIAGVLFALEVLLVDVSITAFIPLLIAGATGALCSNVILSEGILLSFRGLTEFHYQNTLSYALLGVTCGLVSVFYLRAYQRMENMFKNVLTNRFARFAGGTLLLGMLILLLPALFGEGYSSIKFLAASNPAILFRGSIVEGTLTQTKWTLGLAVLVVGLIKVLAVSVTLNAGGNGGNFAPALFVGACVGFCFAFAGHAMGATHLPLANYCLVAMAGILTGIFHSPLTAIFLIAEITGGYGLIIPLMIVSAVSTIVSKYFNPHSLDEAKLHETIASRSHGKDLQILSGLSLPSFLETDFVPLPVGTTLRELTLAIGKSKRNIFPVTEKDGRLVGIIALEDIREVMFDTSRYDSTIVDQLMRKPVVTANLEDDMDEIMEKFDRTGVWNIPVLSDGVYKGFVSKSSVFTSYRQSLRSD